MLKEAAEPLATTHDLAVLDLDGVLYVGADAVPGAVQGVAAAAAAGCRPAYVTNNASRTPAEVAAHLAELGFEAGEEDVVTSAQAAARLLADRLDPGSEVYVIGGRGLEIALADRGLVAVRSATPGVAAVAQGYGPDMPWRQVVAGSILVREGLPWVASNTDSTIPTPRGSGPGNGALVDLVARFADRRPVVAGKPEAPLFEETRARMGADSPIVIGDRLDTDIAGGVNLGWTTLLVLTGVTGLRELVCAPAQHRPDHIGLDLAALTQAHPVPRQEASAWCLGGWRAEVNEASLSITGSGDAANWWRVAAQAAWQHLDRTQSPADVADVRLPG